MRIRKDESNTPKNMWLVEEAMMRIDELEQEHGELKAEIERLKARNLGGRKRHVLTRYNVFGARLLINHAENGKKYLYDILAIKKETSKPQQ